MFAGETLSTEMWQESDLVLFTTKTVERGKIVQEGYVKLRPTARL